MSSPNKDYVVEERALAKLFLHSLKYPYATVTGVLLAKSNQKDAGDAQTNQESVSFFDCVPLTHLNHGLTPSIEIGLLQVNAYAEKHGYSILGYYQANAAFHDDEPDVFAQRVGEKLTELNDKAIILMVRAESLANFWSNESNEGLFTPYALQEGKWKTSNKINIKVNEQGLNSLRELIFDRQSHTKLFDFDNHLDDLKCNWLNPHLHSIIQECVDQV